MNAVNTSVDSSSTSNYLQVFCVDTAISSYISIAYDVMRILLLLPLSTFVLYLGHQRWRQQRSSGPATHSDIFAYHVASMELIWVISNIGCIYTNHSIVATIGISGTSFLLFGETFFHAMTCVERYLAVVHPITYRGLRNARGVKIRNICTGCVWLLSFGLTSFIPLNLPILPISISAFCLIIIFMSFCNVSVLCVLIRPGPGEGGGEKERVDQSKLRAFYTITATSVAVWLWFVGMIVSAAMIITTELSESVRCVVMMSTTWLNLPSSLVSPLLYLHRAGKLSWCC